MKKYRIKNSVKIIAILIIIILIIIFTLGKCDTSKSYSLEYSIGKYDVSENVLFFNETKLAEVTDGKNIMMKALLAVISNRIEEKNNILFAFNKGMDEMIANSLVGNGC